MCFAGQGTRWSHVDARSFALAFSDRGCTVTARVLIDERGAPIDFETTTPVQAWQQIGDHSYPARARATWHLASREFTYAEFDLDPASLAFDVAPSELTGARAA